MSSVQDPYYSSDKGSSEPAPPPPPSQPPPPPAQPQPQPQEPAPPRHTYMGSTRQPSSLPNILLYFLALFIPPLPVFLKRGIAADFWINILLWILGWIPGVLHAWYIIAKSEGAF